MRPRRLLAWGLAAAALAVFVLVGLSSSRSASVGRHAPSLPLARLSGPPVTLAGALAGAHHARTIVTFWASWCGPCAREAPALERFALSPAGRGRLVGVNWSDSLAGARAFIRRYSWTFSNLRDADGAVGNDYRITVLPTSFVIDSSGVIREELRGPQSESSLRRALGVQ